MIWSDFDTSVATSARSGPILCSSHDSSRFTFQLACTIEFSGSESKFLRTCGSIRCRPYPMSLPRQWLRENCSAQKPPPGAAHPSRSAAKTCQSSSPRSSEDCCIGMTNRRFPKQSDVRGATGLGVRSPPPRQIRPDVGKEQTSAEWGPRSAKFGVVSGRICRPILADTVTHGALIWFRLHCTSVCNRAGHAFCSTPLVPRRSGDLVAQAPGRRIHGGFD